MSQVLQSPAKLHKKLSGIENRNLTLTAYPQMVVAAAVLYRMPGWVFHASDPMV